jgi:hypothetical protein
LDTHGWSKRCRTGRAVRVYPRTIASACLFHGFIRFTFYPPAITASSGAARRAAMLYLIFEAALARQQRRARGSHS